MRNTSFRKYGVCRANSQAKRLCRLAIIALATAFAFAALSCGGSGGDPSGPSGGGTVSGTYKHESLNRDITFTNGTFVMRSSKDGASGRPLIEIIRGTYTVSGSTVTGTITWVNTFVDEPPPNTVGQTVKCTIEDANTIVDEDGDYWRK